VSARRPSLLRALTIVGALAICAWLSLGLVQASAVDDARKRILSPDALTRSEAGEVGSQLDRASLLNPDQTVNILRAGLALRQGRVEQARQTMLEVVRDEPENLEAWGAIAVAFEQTDPSLASRARAAIRRLAPSTLQERPQ
jgi:predicted Zn-dependent protease